MSRTKRHRRPRSQSPGAIRRLPNAKRALAGLLLPVLASTAVRATPASESDQIPTEEPASSASVQLLPDQTGQERRYDAPYEVGGPVDAVEQQHVSALLWSAYANAVAGAPTACHLPVSLLAAIGQVDSGSLSGRTLDPGNRVVPAVFGPVLNGDGYAAIADTDRGALDGNKRWDRAVGPMQILPGVWARWGHDGDGDGAADPQDIDDAAVTTAAYLCSGGRDLADPEDLASAILSHNRSRSYLTLVLRWKRDLEAAVPETVALPALWLSTPVATLKPASKPVPKPHAQPTTKPAPVPVSEDEPELETTPEPTPPPATEPPPETVPAPETDDDPTESSPDPADDPSPDECSATSPETSDDPEDGAPAADPESTSSCPPATGQDEPGADPAEPEEPAEPAELAESSGPS